MFAWMYNAIIFDRMTGDILFSEYQYTPDDAQKVIEQKIKHFAEKDTDPVGHVNCDYIMIKDNQR